MKGQLIEYIFIYNTVNLFYILNIPIFHLSPILLDFWNKYKTS